MTDINGIQLNAEDTGGSGRPIVLVHGWPLSGASWSEQIVPLQDSGFRVVTYDRRGFGQSEKPGTGYDYDTLTRDLAAIIDQLNLQDVTIVGFSMGGGEAVRYVTKYGESHLHSLVLAAAVPPMLLKSENNPGGPLTVDLASEMKAGLTDNEDNFYDGFMNGFFTANGELMVTEDQRQAALALCRQADKTAALAAMNSFATTDFREDLKNISVPTLVIHGDADAIVPFEGSGTRSHEAIAASELYVVANGPHGINVSHAEEFNKALIAFLQK